MTVGGFKPGEKDDDLSLVVVQWFERNDYDFIGSLREAEIAEEALVKIEEW